MRSATTVHLRPAAAFFAFGFIPRVGAMALYG
jgi:hypothetical protein